ncbi:DUF7667 family protein [Natribacillus halophilus]|uniref:Uncharacterized protein n=1 Tax=Natribacillus halophilus TaxID=549003 RepID=A0A1G8RV25_9BACI|nr:hypothetical protein [Natribacillus halophilus]SDJ20828.1 hypothetical protein SAMN04488123_12065 [Natribacillus halophilus]
MSPNVIKDRFIDLILTADYRVLTDMEKSELSESKVFLKNFIREHEKLVQMSFLAYMTDDTEWHLNVCSEIDQLKGEEA